MIFLTKNPNQKKNWAGGGGEGWGGGARINDFFTKNPNQEKIRGGGGGVQIK